MGRIGYVVEGDSIKRTELTAGPGVIVFTGYNSTLKSVAARTFLLYRDSAGRIADADLYAPNFLSIGAKVEFVEEHDVVVSTSRRILVPDSRLALRAMLFARERVLEVGRLLEELEKSEREELRAVEIRMIRENVNRILNSVGVGFLDDVAKAKAEASLEVAYRILSELRLVVREVAEELEEEFETEEQALEAIMPLVVASLSRERMEVLVHDRRFGAIRQENVSTSVIAPLLFDYVTAILSLPGNKVLAIEEPEESLTPLQQLVFARYLERATTKSMEILGGEAYVVVTTHSPYIALAFSERVPVKFFRYDFKERKIVVEDKPLKSFALAEVVLARLGVRE